MNKQKINNVRSVFIAFVSIVLIFAIFLTASIAVDRYKKLKEDNSTLVVRNTELEENNQILSQSNITLREDYAIVTREKAVLESQVENLNTDIAELNLEIQSKNGTITRLMSSMDAGQSRIRFLEEEIGRYNQLLLEIDNMLDEETNLQEIESLEAERTRIIAILNEYAEEMANIELEIVNLTQEKSNLESQVSNLNSEIESKTEEINIKTQTISTLQNTISELQTRIAELEERLQEQNNGENEEVTPTSAQYFTFDGNKITSYIGSDTEIVLPRSYSLGSVVEETKIVDNMEFDEFINSYDFSSPLTISADGNEYVLNSIDDYYDLMLWDSEITYTYSKQTYVDGNDYQVSNIDGKCFYDRSDLTKITILDNILKIDNSRNKQVFYGVSAEIVFPEGFGAEMTSMEYLFAGYQGTSLDLSNFNTSNVINMRNMFSNIVNITELDLSSFDTRNVTMMDSMFLFGYGNASSNLTTIDLSSFNIDSVTNIYSMFDGCSSLTTIYVSANNSDWTINAQLLSHSNGMFGTAGYAYCDLLPNYDRSVNNGQGAKLSTNGGYFTLKTANAE